jgi:hypothetical protein
MERFAEKIQRVITDAERQFRQLVATNCEIQHSYLFRDGKFIGVRFACDIYRIEWQIATDQMTLIQDAGEKPPSQSDPTEDRRAA